MSRVVLSIGSNIGDREQMLQSALDLLHGRDLAIRRISPVYETEPVDFKQQRAFLNLAAPRFSRDGKRIAHTNWKRRPIGCAPSGGGRGLSMWISSRAMTESAK